MQKELILLACRTTGTVELETLLTAESLRGLASPIVNLLHASEESLSASAVLDLLTAHDIKFNLSNASAMTGTLEDLEALLTAETVTGIQDQDLLLIDMEATATSVLALLGAINGEIDLPNLDQLNGNATERNQVFNADRLVLGLADDQPPEVMRVTSSKTVIGPLSTANFWVEFSEPVTLDPVRNHPAGTSNGSSPSGSTHRPQAPPSQQRFRV